MRICYLSGSKIPSRAANSVHVMKMARAMAAGGHDLTLFCRSGREVTGVDEFGHYGVTRTFDLVRCWWPSVRFVGGLLYANAVARAARRRGLPDLFYGRHIPSLAAALPYDRPVRLEVHAPPQNPLEGMLLRGLFRAPQFEKLVVISDALRREYMRLFPSLAAAKIVVAHDGADLPQEEQHFGPSQGESAPPKVGYVGQLYRGKGMEVIDSVSRLMPAVEFHVVGGSEADVDLWRKKMLGRSNVRFHGHVAHSRIGVFLRQFTLVVAPYQDVVRVYGGAGDVAKWMSPLKLFEYMAHGKAIIASDLPVLREIIVDGVNGVLCSPSDPHAWVGAISRLLADPASARDMSARARALVRERYTWDARAKHVLA